MNDPATPTPSYGRAAWTRGALYLGFWLLLAAPREGGPGWAAIADLTLGLLAAAAATWVSLRLLPPAPGRLGFGALGRLVAHFVWQSIVAGVDVARRAFDPRLPLRPGYLPYSVGLPSGPMRSAFGALTSLMPGTLPVGTDAKDALVYHCLDMGQPVAANLNRDEALLARVRREDAEHD